MFFTAYSARNRVASIALEGEDISRNCIALDVPEGTLKKVGKGDAVIQCKGMAILMKRDLKKGTILHESGFPLTFTRQGFLHITLRSLDEVGRLAVMDNLDHVETPGYCRFCDIQIHSLSGFVYNKCPYCERVLEHGVIPLPDNTPNPALETAIPVSPVMLNEIKHLLVGTTLPDDPRTPVEARDSMLDQIACLLPGSLRVLQDITPPPALPPEIREIPQPGDPYQDHVVPAALVPKDDFEEIRNILSRASGTFVELSWRQRADDMLKRMGGAYAPEPQNVNVGDLVPEGDPLPKPELAFDPPPCQHIADQPNAGDLQSPPVVERHGGFPKGDQGER